MALWRVRATVRDQPGFLAVLAASLALRSVNILSVGVHITEAGAVDDFLVDTPDDLTREQLLAAVERGRGRDAWVAPAEAHSLVDAPTRALDLATCLMDNAGWAGGEAVGHALAELLDARATWLPVAERLGVDGARMWAPGPDGGAWLLERPGPEFTPAEYARAQALLAVSLAVSAAAGRREAVLLLPDGTELTIRRARPADLPAVRGMHDRCAPEQLHQRYLAGPAGPSDAQLARLLAPARGLTLLAESAGAVIGMANLLGEGVQAELALLVEGAWQRRGIGTALLRRALPAAAESGFDAVVVHGRAGNAALERTLRRLAAVPRRVHRDAGLVTVTFPLARDATVPRR